ncbi:TEMPT-like protein [Mya arenaria]|uniref:TEMPT-like protein n=1 Tax=Mya arenaria TaxID=6604 RepID=A0ABY7DES0_MYAAR|nr:TEMPT-like protein [Mya arenaria]
MRVSYGFFVFVICTAVQFAKGYPEYMKLIPNGERVMDPCLSPVVKQWKRVGHEIKFKKDDTTDPKGTLNDFGVNFREIQEKAGMKPENIWAELCHIDSDKDKRTNGEELGDPKCMWTVGEPNPGDVRELTHPVCKND